MTRDEALLMAIEAIENADYHNDLEAIAVIKDILAQPESEYERGFIDGMQKQMQSSVDKAVNAMTQPTYYIPNKDERTWVGLTDEDRFELAKAQHSWEELCLAVEAKLKEKNG